MLLSTKEFKNATAHRRSAREFRERAEANVGRSLRALEREGRLTWFALHCARAAGSDLEISAYMDRSAARNLRRACELADEGR